MKSFFANIDEKYKTHAFYLLCLVLFSLLIYFPTLFAEPFWDDWVFIFKSVHGQMNSSSPLIFFPGGKEAKSWPIFFTVIWGMYKTFQSNYFLYHLVNIILHGVNGYLCWVILTKIKVKHGLLLALLFLAHPLHLFTVAWIIQLKTILSLFFFLVSLLLLIVFYQKEKIGLLLSSILFFILSIFSKSTTVAFGACLLFVYPVIKQKISLKKFVLLFLVPFIVLSAAATIRTAWTFNIKEFLLREKIKDDPGNYSSFNYTVTEKPQNQGEVPFEKLKKAARAILTTKLFLRYAIFTIFPLEGYHLFQEKTNLTYSSLEFLWLLSGVFCFYFLIAHLIKKKLHTELLGLIFYFASMLPFCAIVYIPIYSISNFVPYWLSIPLVGLLPLISYLIRSEKVLISIIVIFTVISHWQAYSFILTEDIFLESIKRSPDTQVYRVALIEHYVFTNQCEKAKEAYKNFKESEFTSIYCLDIKTNACGSKKEK
jgi:hypothetical protein